MVYSDTTQTTRDYGVDAYLVVSIKERVQTYTIEAKLRTSDTLSLKDFATSILYYLINTSSRHFIVTNVSYSYEAVKYIRQSNLRNEKIIELIDGQLLQNVINDHLKQFYGFPLELRNYILNRKFDNASLVAGDITVQQKDQNYIELPYYSALLEDVRNHFQSGHNFFVVTGISGTGKSIWIQYCVDKLFEGYVVQKFDISLIQTPKLFVYEILHLLLGFNIEKLFTELSMDNSKVKDLISQFQVFPCDSAQITDAVKFLLISKENESETYVYYMHLLVEHLHKHFLINMHTIAVIENLHEATAEMIEFVIRTMYCLGKKNVIVFWEIPTFRNARQIPHVSVEQWNDFIYLLTSKNVGQGVLPYCISLDGLLENEVYGKIEENVKDIIGSYIPGIAFTSGFVRVFIKFFGLKIRSIFEALNIIKMNNLYSSAALEVVHMNSSIIIKEQIIHLMGNESESREFYQFVFNFVNLLDGKLDTAVIQYLDSIFMTDSNMTLIHSGLFYRENSILRFQYQTMIKALKNHLNPGMQKKCAKWLLAHLDELEMNYIDRKYYGILFQYLVSPLDAICKMNETIDVLYHCKVYRYALSLASIRCEYYRQTEDEVLYYQYFVQYISCLKTSTSDWNVLNTSMKYAESLRSQLAIKYFNDKRYIQTNLKLALIQYQVSKVNYDYADCEQKIQYILNYEDDFGESELFIIAKIYNALIKKEQGFRKEFVLELIDNFQRYPNNLDIKVTYYINLAAMYKFSHRHIAIKLVRTARNLTFDSQKGHGDLEVEVNLLHLLCQENNETVLEYIRFIRFAAEKINSMYILAKTFNIEAYHYIRNLSDNEDSIVRCLRSAVFHSLSNGHTKQTFLFGLNLVTILISCGRDCIEEFNSVFNWYNNNKMVVKRLKQNPYKHKDHMFTALVSLFYIAQTIKMADVEQIILEFFPEFKNMTEKELLKQVPDYYKVTYRMATRKKDIIFLLF